MFRMIKTFSNLVLLTVISLLLTNCNAILVPKYQNVEIITNSDENEVYLDNELLCKGKYSVVKINKKTTKGQISVIREGHKPVYDVILRNKRPAAFYPLVLLGSPTFIVGLIADFTTPKCQLFESKKTINSEGDEYLIPIKKEEEKYLNLSGVRFDIQDKTKDIIKIPLYHSENLRKNLKNSKYSFYKNGDFNPELNAILFRESPIISKENSGKKLVTGEQELKIQGIDPEINSELLNTLKRSSYIDTITKIFKNENNTLELDVTIKKITYYLIEARWGQIYCNTKLNLTWYLKNNYKEILDSIETLDFSGNFYLCHNNIDFELEERFYNKTFDKNHHNFIKDAVLNSYLNLTKNSTFKNHLKLIKDFSIEEEKLQFNKINNDVKVASISDAFKATVIVKAKENNKDVGHGSGFAISKDGYILTNYHVIAGKYANKQNEISVVTSSGQELPAKIVRFNKFRDVALLKIDYSFEKVFYLENQNKAEVMIDVLTIGAPKSIELGQSVTTGIISNIRNENENKYLQLNMSINGGNSGGPIFDSQGNLHGIVVSKLVGFATEGVGFAIPSYMVTEYLNLEVK
jgi:S1-C subfamily serine protease